MPQKILEQLVLKIDKFQQKQPFLGFAYAVVKKYGEDEAAYLGALITYYGFLSLFPLLLVATTVIKLVLKSHEALGNRLIEGISHYFPVFGSDLQSNIHSLNKTGIALIVGILFTLYGARGGANAFQHALNHIWQVPRVKRPGFPHNAIKSLVIILSGGSGLILAAVLSGYSAGLNHIFILRIVPLLISFSVLSTIFYFLFRYSVADKGPSKKETLISAGVAAVGVQILQSVGLYLITHELRNLDSLYGATFAIVLGLLFWIYLQAQVVLYAVEIGSVHSLRLWPRSIVTNKNMTEADKRAYAMLAKKEKFHPPEEISVAFRDK